MNNPKPNAKTNNRKLIVRIVVVALVGVFLGVQFYAVNSARLVGDAMPMPLGFGVSVVLSGSMEPELSVNDLIVVTPKDEYTVDDVVVYQVRGTLIVHRIIEITEDGVITQGDANNAPDDPIKMKDIKGEVAFSVPFLGTVVQFTKTPVGIVIVLAAALLLMELSFSRDKKKDDDTLEQLKEEIRRIKSESSNNDDSVNNDDNSDTTS